MSKKAITVTIEFDVYNELKAKNLNISQTIEKLLKDYLATLATPDEQQRARQVILDAQEEAEDDKYVRIILTYKDSPYLLRLQTLYLKKKGFSDERINRLFDKAQKIQAATPFPNIKIVRDLSDFQPAGVPAQAPGNSDIQ